MGETEVAAEVETEAFRQEVVNMEIKYQYLETFSRKRQVFNLLVTLYARSSGGSFGVGAGPASSSAPRSSWARS